jgi:hypothetical protein
MVALTQHKQPKERQNNSLGFLKEINGKTRSAARNHSTNV